MPRPPRFSCPHRRKGAATLPTEVTPGVETAYYTYDGRGNQVTQEVVDGYTTYFDHNSRNLITRIDSTDPEFTTPNTFAYNALGQRIRITDSTGTTYYVWDGIRITHEHDGSGTLLKRYTYGHAEIEGVSDLLDLHHLDGDTNPHYFYHLDQVGGTRVLTDAGQDCDKAYEFTPFGRILSETGSAPNDFAFPATYLLIGDIPCARASLTRLYDASSARYVSRDLLRDWDYPGPGLYTYARNAPLGYGDPFGLKDDWLDDPNWLDLALKDGRGISKLRHEGETYLRYRGRRPGATGETAWLKLGDEWRRSVQVAPGRTEIRPATPDEQDELRPRIDIKRPNLWRNPKNEKEFHPCAYIIFMGHHGWQRKRIFAEYHTPREFMTKIYPMACFAMHPRVGLKLPEGTALDPERIAPIKVPKIVGKISPFQMTYDPLEDPEYGGGKAEDSGSPAAAWDRLYTEARAAMIAHAAKDSQNCKKCCKRLFVYVACQDEVRKDRTGKESQSDRRMVQALKHKPYCHRVLQIFDCKKVQP